MKKMTSLACIIVILSGILLSGCGGSGSPEADHSGPKRDSTPQVLTPTADHRTRELYCISTYCRQWQLFHTGDGKYRRRFVRVIVRANR